MSTILAEKIERNRNTRNGRKSRGNRKPFWFRAAQATHVGVPVRLGAIAAVMLSVGAAFAGVGAPSRLTQDRMMAAFQDANIPASPICSSRPSSRISGPRFTTARSRRDGVFGSMASW
jgi:hypothetical protein